MPEMRTAQFSRSLQGSLDCQAIGELDYAGIIRCPDYISCHAFILLGWRAKLTTCSDAALG
jgi:hypothetical protein